MFFNRSPMTQAESDNESPSTAAAPQSALPSALRRSHRRSRRRRAMVLSMAIAAGAPLVGVIISHSAHLAHAADATHLDTSMNASALAAANDNADLYTARAELAQLGEPVDDAGKLAKGIAQYNAHAYEESVATLQSVNVDQLSAQGKSTLTDTLAKATAASEQRKAARAEFEKGEQALSSNQSAEAMTHYKAASENKYADEGTVAKAKEQMVLAQDASQKSAVDQKAVYRQAIDDYKAGRYADARTKFSQLQASNFKAPWFQKSPGDYVKDIDGKMAAAPAAAPVVAAVPAADPAATPAAEATGTAATPTTAPSMEASATPAPAAPTTPTANPSEAYHLARKQFNNGDWIAARQNFVMARDSGYKAGLFEDAPSKYLTRMDEKEQADDRRHREQLRQQEAFAAASAATPAVVAVAPTVDAQHHDARHHDARHCDSKHHAGSRR